MTTLDTFDTLRAGDVVRAWDLIGFDTVNGLCVRVKGGRALYEAVTYYDCTPGENVKLSRLEVAATAADGLRQIDRYVDAETWLELVDPDGTAHTPQTTTCADCDGRGHEPFTYYIGSTRFASVRECPRCEGSGKVTS